MIGNDIVDLNEASKSRHWPSPRFISKVFTACERDLILHSSNPFHTTWVLWSMKEGAYKVHLRKFRKPFFSPVKIKCQIEPDGAGKVIIGGITYTTNTLIKEDYIYSVVMTDSTRDYIGNIHRVLDISYTNLHNKCYQDVIEMSSSQLNEHGRTKEIKKDEFGIPKLFINNREQPLIFSITVDSLPERSNEISGLMVTAIIGGAIVPILFGGVADLFGLMAGFAVPGLSMVYILLIALRPQNT